jgi:tetratricopeptide (TPR) repeat protein
VFPNHPRALLSMAELARKEKRMQPRGSEYDLDCWFERAVRFRPDDGNVRLVFGIALMRDAKYDKAVEQFGIAEQAMPNSADVHYNMGLAYYHLGNYDDALVRAKRAYELGHPLPGLRRMLEKAGRWQ